MNVVQTDKYQQCFEKVFSSVPVSEDRVREDMCYLAKAVWFDGFVPDLSELTNVAAARRAAYTVDFFAAAHMLDADSKQTLQKVVEDFRAKLSAEDLAEETFYAAEVKPRKNRDDFARRWYLASGMKPRSLGLLDMQRRENLHSQMA